MLLYLFVDTTQINSVIKVGSIIELVENVPDLKEYKLRASQNYEVKHKIVLGQDVLYVDGKGKECFIAVDRHLTIFAEYFKLRKFNKEQLLQYYHL